MKLNVTLGAVLGTAALLLGTAGISPDVAFVLSGDYFRARAAAANCDKTFIPALGRETRQERYLAASLLPIDFKALAYTYRTVDLEEGTYDVYEGSEYEGLRLAPGTRMETFVGDGFATTVISGMTSAGCARLVLSGDAVIQVQIDGSSITTSADFWNLYLSELAGTGDKIKRTVQQRAIPAGTGKLLVKVYIDGQPAADQKVHLSVWPLAYPPKGIGRTFAHDHIALEPGRYEATIRINGAMNRTVTTNEFGEAEVEIQGGSRGGVEGVRGEFVYEGLTFVGERAIVVRHNRSFEHFAEALGFSAQNPPVASSSFPFVLTGYTPEHGYAHWLQTGKSSQIANILRDVWTQDTRRVQYEATDSTPHYLVLNDMSLEYGGTFHLRAASRGNVIPACTIEEEGGAYWPHNGHDTGLEVDVSPCYSNGMTHLGATACAQGLTRKIDERVLVAHVLGRLGGAVLIEGAGTAQYHYHLRFPLEY